jgi:hypothetical protein
LPAPEPAVFQAGGFAFSGQARASSRAVAVSAYLFVEGLYLEKKSRMVPAFVTFYVKLMEEIKNNLNLLSKFREPTNPTILEGFQKYISEA